MFDAFYADPHFGHERIIELCDRPFNSVTEMNEELIRRYNKRVNLNDIVAILGDCFFTNIKESREIMERLNGRKVLIWGGHDRSFSATLRMGFEAVTYQMDIRIADKICTLCHFPYAGTSKHDTGEVDDRYEHLRPVKKKGQLLIHGHTHQKRRVYGNMIHVGVDAWDYAPVRKHEIIELIVRMG